MNLTKQQLIDAMEHISFEMNRYLYTARPCSLPGRYCEAVRESCLLHSRNIGEFFFGGESKSDIRIEHYYKELISEHELKIEIDKFKPMWIEYKKRINKRLSHLTYDRVINASRISMEEKNYIGFDYLIELFEKNLPLEFREKWNFGKSFSI